MAQFNFHNMVSEITKMDTQLQTGPMMRWQRKAAEAGLKLPTGEERPGGNSPWRSRSAKTPGITPKTPGSGRMPLSPGKTPGKNQSKTPGKTQSKTPGKQQNKATSKTPSKTPNKHGQQDRFIPNRATTDIDMGHYAIMTERDENTSPSKVTYTQQLNDAMTKGRNPQDSKILSFNTKAPKTAEGHMNNLKVLYSSGKTQAPKGSSTRYIPQQPDRILDAPELLDDYYLNLLEWSQENHLAVALGGAVYLWNAADSTIVPLMEMSSEDDYVSSVSWISEGNILSVGTNLGNVQLWDVSAQKLVRTMPGHAARVGSLSWNSHIVSSGARSGSVFHHDVRIAEHHVGTLSNHSQEVCGLTWSPDGRFLASGGNDNLINVWDINMSHETTPVHTFTHHQAAVKALSWCPWQPQLLASGGGTADRNIRFWNIGTGACLNARDTNSQVSSILWSKEHKELISGHGYSQNQLTIWKYPSMVRVADLTGHSERVLCLTMSPDGTTVASAAADETIRLWRCFATDKQKKTTVVKPTVQRGSLSLHRGIR